MSDLKQLIKNIENWAEDRNLIKGSTPQKQSIKLAEELGDLCSGIAKNNHTLIKDSIGDCFVVSVILAKQARIKFYSKNVEERYIAGYEFYLSGLLRTASDIITPLNPINSHDYVGGKTRIRISELYFCLLGIAEQLDFDLTECVQAAWDEIKDHKGSMIDGVFVKEGDL